MLKFGETFIKHIRTLYNNIETCVTNNGYSSQFFKPTRGIRYGCPISALLFITVVEILANAIRNNPRISRIKIDRIEWKIGQYADDTSLFINDEHSLSLVLLLIDMFSKCSSLRMNHDKSEAIYIGVSSNFRHKNNLIKWSNDYIKCLGIYINSNTQKASEHSIQEKINKMENIIKIWKCRYLTLKGKITIVNSLILSQMLYIASVIHIPEWAITKYNQLVLSFIWDNKPAKLNMNPLSLPYQKEGSNCKTSKQKSKLIK
jgi:hypothetical protein